MAELPSDTASPTTPVRNVSGLFMNPPPLAHIVTPAGNNLELGLASPKSDKPSSASSTNTGHSASSGQSTTTSTSDSSTSSSSQAAARKPGGWVAKAARRDHQPKKNAGEGQKAAAAAKALAGQPRLHRQPSNGSITLGTSQPTGQAASPGRSNSITSDTSSEHRQSIMSGGATSARSTAQYQCFKATHSRKGSSTSLRKCYAASQKGANNTAGSLRGDVGFTFKNTTNFVHPNPPVAKATHLNRGSASTSVMYQDEPEDIVVERMNSVTSDGGWQHGWSVSGSVQGSFSVPSWGRPSGDASDDWDDHVEDLAPEEQDPPTAPVSAREATPEQRRTVSEDDDIAPEQRLAALENDDIAADDQVDTTTKELDEVSPDSDRLSPTRQRSVSSAANSMRALRSRASSLSIRRRAKEDEDDGPRSGPTSPIKSHFERAFSMLTPETECEDPLARAGKIAAARRAFEEKEAAKDRKQAEKAAKKEIKRRKSDARWRKPSNAIDSAVEVIEEEGEFTFSPARSNSLLQKGRSISPLDECDPLSEVPDEDANFPAYAEASAPDHSMFSSQYLEDPQDSALFPPAASGKFPQVNSQGGLFPAMSQQFYEIDGQLYDEYGEPVSSTQDGPEEQRGRRLSKTKIAKGTLSKFSAWGKTRMLRV